MKAFLTMETSYVVFKVVQYLKQLYEAGLYVYIGSQGQEFCGYLLHTFKFNQFLLYRYWNNCKITAVSAVLAFTLNFRKKISHVVLCRILYYTGMNTLKWIHPQIRYFWDIFGWIRCVMLRKVNAFLMEKYIICSWHVLPLMKQHETVCITCSSTENRLIWRLEGKSGHSIFKLGNNKFFHPEIFIFSKMPLNMFIH